MWHQVSDCGDAARRGESAPLLARGETLPSVLGCLVEHRPGAFRENKGCSGLKLQGYAWEASPLPPAVRLGENCPQAFLVKSGTSCAGCPKSRGEQRYSRSSGATLLADPGLLEDPSRDNSSRLGIGATGGCLGSSAGA